MDRNFSNNHHSGAPPPQVPNNNHNHNHNAGLALHQSPNDTSFYYPSESYDAYAGGNYSAYAAGQPWSFAPGPFDLYAGDPSSMRAGWQDPSEHGQGYQPHLHEPHAANAVFQDSLPSNINSPTFANSSEFSHFPTSNFAISGLHPTQISQKDLSTQGSGTPITRGSASPLIRGASGTPQQRESGSPHSRQTPATVTPQSLQSNGESTATALASEQAEPMTKSSNRDASASQKSTPASSAAAAAQAGPLLAMLALANAIPKGSPDGDFLIMKEDSFAQSVPSKRLHNFLSVGEEAVEVPTTKSTVPSYQPRKSRNEIKRLLANDSKLSASVSKKTTKAIGSTVKPIPLHGGPAGQPSTQTAQKHAERSSSADSSSDESDYKSSDDEAARPPLPPTRPTNTLEAIRYDTIKALWRFSGQTISAESIRKGMSDFCNIIETIRDRWRSDNAAVAQAEKSNRHSEVPLLKERVKSQLDMLEAALVAAVEQGHPDILDHLGAHSKVILCLAVFLTDRVKDSDYNGGISKAGLEFLSRCKAFETSLMEKTGIGKLLIRYQKRGSENIRVLAKKVAENAAAATKRRKEATKAAVSAASQAKEQKGPTESAKKSLPSTAGTKRPLDSSSTVADSQPAKKLASSEKAGQWKPVSPAKKPPVSATNTKATTPAAAAVAAVTKGSAVGNKPSSFFSSLQSAGKRSTSATASKPTSVAAAAPSSGSTFSFSEAFADIVRPKETTPAQSRQVQEEKKTEETAAERIKRLRKEGRRNLRVSFKPDSSLVDVRYFEHDPEEELGHDASQTRDAGDIGKEGKMFKLQHQYHINEIDVDEDDDEATADVVSDVSGRSWKGTTEIDFSTLVQATREQNYAPYGGGLSTPESPERSVQEDREASTLLVVYTERSEIPDSPKEPAAGQGSEQGEPKSFGSPPNHIKARADEMRETIPQLPQPPTTDLSSHDLGALLKALQPVQQQSGNPTGLGELEKIVSQLNPALSPQSQQQPSSSWYQSAQTGGATPSLGDILSSLTQAGSGAPAPPVQPSDSPANFSQAPYSVPAPSFSQPQPSTGAPDLSAILAQLQPQAPSQPQPSNYMAAFPPMSGMPNMSQMASQSQSMPQPADWQSWMAQAHQFASQGLPGMPSMSEMMGVAQVPQNSSAGLYENEERKRRREQADDDLHDTNGKRHRQERGPQKAAARSKDQNYSPPKFIVQCKYWNEGKCRKGADCTFRHDGPSGGN